MPSRRSFLKTAALLPALASSAPADDLDPRGRLHIPIGIPNTLDTLKTFVEAEGNFSPGVGTYGIYFWLYDLDASQLTAPTMDGVHVDHGLAPGGLLIPWSEWTASGLTVRTEVCQVQLDLHVAAARVLVSNPGPTPRKVALYVALRPLGAAGGDVNRLEVIGGDALLVNGHTALVADRRPNKCGVLPTDTIGDLARKGVVPETQSATGDCSGAMRFDWTIPTGASENAGFILPVLAGRRAARHHWVDRKQNALVDAAELNPMEGGLLQPEPGPAHFRKLRANALFEKAAAYWTSMLQSLDIRMPDPRWGESMRAILAHAAMCMNEGAPDVAVVNYNVFNRDGMYIANIMQKSGQKALSETILDYFTAHPFNGRAYPESDNPGQILWAAREHWLLTRDRAWLARIYPAVAKLAGMIRYYRTGPGPYWVSMTTLAYGDDAPKSDRHELKPGRCDGFHPEYTEAFDAAGLRAAAELAGAAGRTEDATAWRTLAAKLIEDYDQKFGARLPREYGSYSVLWPCRLYPLQSGRAWEQFRNIGAQQPTSWRYFPLATAHQGLLAGNRAAAHGTLDIHLAHEQMKGWYAFDEGGGSGGGAWYRTRTRWPHSKSRPGDNEAVAMPHGWAIAEFWLLVRDAIVYEDDGRLILLAGVPPDWFQSPEGMSARGLATHYGTLDLAWKGGKLKLGGTAAPPKGFLLRLPGEDRRIP